MYAENSLQTVFSKPIHLLIYEVLVHMVSQDLLPFYIHKSPSLLIKLFLPRANHFKRNYGILKEAVI